MEWKCDNKIKVKRNCMKKTVLALGPYIGDFKNEILNFQPHIKWIHEVVGIDNVYVCTHRNRSFPA